jgi:ankyrin repeat-rich membrane spanning protein
MTALIVAVKGGYTQSVKEILKRNPNVNLTDKDGNTALMIASKEGHIEIVQDLLDAGTYVNIPDRVGAYFRFVISGEVDRKLAPYHQDSSHVT